MAAFKFENFQGMWPKISNRLLPPTHAVDATNIKAVSGELRGIRELKAIYEWNGADFPATDQIWRRIHRMLDEDEEYLVSDDLDTMFMNSLTADDTHKRYYYSNSDTAPTYYNTKTRILNGDSWWSLGVPQPTTKLTVSPPGSGTGDQVDRFYTYTFVTEYGEEGPPAPVSDVKTGYIDQLWELTNFDNLSTAPSDHTNRNITHVNIYRTEIAASGLASYFYVDQSEWPIDPIEQGGTEVAGAHTAVATTITVDDASVFNGITTPFYASIGLGSDYEIVQVTSFTTSPSPEELTVVRAQQGTTARAIADNDYVTHNIHEFWDDGNQEQYLPTTVTANEILTSTTWFPPPDNLQDLQPHPGGFAVGFSGQTIWFSEPNYPHAWPPEYSVVIPVPIVALRILGNSVVILTEGAPQILTGSHPLNMAPSAFPVVEPCLSRHSAVSMGVGVAYASPNGLQLLTLGGIQNVTKDMISKVDWLEEYDPGNLVAARYQTMYFALSEGEESGFFINFDGNQPDLVYLNNIVSRETRVSVEGGGYTGRPASNSDVQVYAQNDYRTGELMLVVNNKDTGEPSKTVMYLWDVSSQMPIEYKWTSKQIHVADPINIGAGIVYADKASVGQASPLIPVQTSPRAPTGITEKAKDPFIEVSLFRGGDSVPAQQIIVKPNETFRFSSRAMSDIWQVRIRSNMNIYSMAVAETARELEDV